VIEDDGKILLIRQGRFSVESSNKKKKIKRQCPFKASFSFVYNQKLYYIN